MNDLMESIRRITNERIQKEEGEFNVREHNLVELVRRNYEDWVKLFEVLKLKKVGCYDYLVDLLASEEIGLQTSVGALRKAFSLVRAERGERVFKGTGQAYANQRWDSSMSRSNAFHEAQRSRYSSSSGAARSNPAPVSQVKRPGPVERLAASVPVPGGTLPGGVEEGVVWTWDDSEPVFQGVKLKVWGGVPLVDKLKTIGRQVEEIAALSPLEDVRSTREFLVRFMEATGHQSMKDGEKYVEVNWPPYAVGLLDRLQERLSK